ncbi:hypothetical protein AAI421_28540 (plasmid) [Rhodococcus aetherivorans]|uniref:hypothetical protein n=1 Tax=Rhodococcus aetherivorans TaxID=191292 RepID=UPI0031DD6E0E
MRKILVAAAGLLLIPFGFIVSPGYALADQASCTGTPQNPVFPNYASDEVLDTIVNSRTGSQPIPIRRGWYCVPAGSQDELNDGKGFGLDKVQNRHWIGRPQVGWHQEEAVLAVKAVLNSSNVNQVSSPWGGSGWNYHAWSAFGEGCAYDAPDASCGRAEQLHVVGVSTTGGADYDPQGGMPAGTPLGLQTVYCDYNDNGQEDDAGLRCAEWVTAALLDIAYDEGLAD